MNSNELTQDVVSSFPISSVPSSTQTNYHHVPTTSYSAFNPDSGYTTEDQPFSRNDHLMEQSSNTNMNNNISSSCLPSYSHGSSSTSSSSSQQSMYLFRAKTNDAYIIKILIELLHNNIKTGCFEITQEGIHFCMADSNRRTLIHIQLYQKDFNVFSLQQPMNLGLNVNHFYKMLKSIKKKDSLVLFITDDRPTELGIQIIPKDHSRLTISYVRIQNIQNLEIMLPEPYHHSILVSASEFAKMCKDMFNISNTITVSANRWNVRFVCNLGSVYSRQVILGETENEHSAILASSAPVYTFNDDFDAEQLSRIMKISGLSSNLNIHCEKQMPMMIRSKIGNLGVISIYIKSRQQIEEEEIISNDLSIVP